MKDYSVLIKEVTKLIDNKIEMFEKFESRGSKTIRSAHYYMRELKKEVESINY